MISKSKAKFIKSLQIKKYRKQLQCFLAEGAKNVLEALDAQFEVTVLVATKEFIAENERKIGAAKEVIEVEERILPQLGTFQTNDSALAVVKMEKAPALKLEAGRYYIALEGVKDPGNLGTILRIADWYGIHDIVASEDTADFYNPKVINASMGSFSRIRLHYVDLYDLLKNTALTVYGATIDGANAHQVSFDEGGILIFGNESKGISENMAGVIDRYIGIPKYGHAESLNVAVSVGIICDLVRRS